jgi:hypothetical protein
VGRARGGTDGRNPFGVVFDGFGAGVTVTRVVAVAVTVAVAVVVTGVVTVEVMVTVLVTAGVAFA